MGTIAPRNAVSKAYSGLGFVRRALKSSHELRIEALREHNHIYHSNRFKFHPNQALQAHWGFSEMFFAAHQLAPTKGIVKLCTHGNVASTWVQESAREGSTQLICIAKAEVPSPDCNPCNLGTADGCEIRQVQIRRANISWLFFVSQPSTSWKK